MPELPEVERVRRTLEPRLIGRTVAAAAVHRRDVVRGGATAGNLLAGRRIERLQRHGKQLAMVAADERCVCVHLGMSGSLRYRAPFAAELAPRLSLVDQDSPHGPQAAPLNEHLGTAVGDPHMHVVWRLDDGGTLAFRDPRRFGGVWTFPTLAALLDRRWRRLGPDALSITPGELARRLAGKRQPIKAALLNQALAAGLGNIYVDELLFACELSPRRPAGTLDRRQVRGLVRRMRSLLRRAIEAGGSTFRDYADAEGRPGGFQRRHRVYGRAGLPCRSCRRDLASMIVAGRTTVFCERCQG